VSLNDSDMLDEIFSPTPETGDEATPKKVANSKVPVTKRSTVSSGTEFSTKSHFSNEKNQQKKTPKAASENDELPAKKRRRSTLPSNVNRSNHHNNNNEVVQDFKNDYLSPAPRARNVARAVIDRPDIAKPEAQELDVSTITDTLKSKNITASTSKFGFIGLGIIGSGIVKNLINSGHDVCVYNRTHDKTGKFKKAGAKVMLTPSDVIEHADITFSCVSDPEALQHVRKCNC
jgi:3-hydroxyisobutyrate dehydrogenase